MVYPDFSYYRSTQIVLFFINCLLTTFSYYLGVNLVIQIYGKQISFKRKCIFSIVFATLFMGIIYALGLAREVSEPDLRAILEQIEPFFRVILPFSYIVLYYLGIRILKLSAYRSLKIMQLLYIYCLCCSLMLRISRYSLFPPKIDPRGFNYLQEIFMLLLGTLIIFVFYKVVATRINKHKGNVYFSDNIVVKNIRWEMVKNLIICCFFYGVYILNSYPKADVRHYVYLLLLFVGYIGVSILKEFNAIFYGRLLNKREHIGELNQSLSDFRGIKHDWNNILQTYSGYLEIGDLEKLKKYHQSVVKTIVGADTNMSLSQKHIENPSFFGLLKSKWRLAQNKEVNIQFQLLCSIENTYIAELDFNRVMANLLDNAIEAAEQTPSKLVSLTCRKKPDQSLLFILTNDVAEDIDTEKVCASGFTTKVGHLGHGLSQVQNILHKYGNSTFYMDCYMERFNVYLELKPR